MQMHLYNANQMHKQKVDGTYSLQGTVCAIRKEKLQWEHEEMVHTEPWNMG